MLLLAILLVIAVMAIVYYDSKNKDSFEDDSTTSKARIVDFNMPFLSMVLFMVKWALASIPALIIMWLLFMVFGGLLTGLTGIVGAGHM